MPYIEIDNLPRSVKNVLPEHAQEIYLAAFNKAWDGHINDLKDQRETACHKIAWTAVKTVYEKKGDKWSLKVSQ